ncbi:MAG TPA: PilZ domain-containing protein [Gemmataceae bacterium]|nr:PilZ domain-containing protein [Gemmataceae bacterium]
MTGSGDRHADRLPVTAGTSCSFISPVVENFGPARVRDVSMEGVGLILTHAVPLGTLLAVGLSNSQKGIAKTVLVRVVHSTPTHGGFLVGGTFVTPLSYQELTAMVM